MACLRECLPGNDAEGASNVFNCDDAAAFQPATAIGDMAQVSASTRMYALTLCGVLLMINSTTLFLELLLALLTCPHDVCTHHSKHAPASESVPSQRAGWQAQSAKAPAEGHSLCPSCVKCGNCNVLLTRRAAFRTPLDRICSRSCCHYCNSYGGQLRACLQSCAVCIYS